MKGIFLMMFLFCSNLMMYADSLDSLHEELQAHPQVQEKIYIHTDNTCYFIGDTLWYKAYVTRSDDMHFTDMSKMLYVELLNPDGIVLQRQRVIISDKGYGNGDFVFPDSLYSGYYELRAYTRWDLNFNVGEKRYSIDDARKFYNYQIAKDYFRDWQGLYSRVFPVYAKPEQPGDFDKKYMYGRPRQDLIASPKPKLVVKFYPEGGTLVEGIRSRVAFEATDQDGKAVDLTGSLSDGTKLKTDYFGRGVFEVVPNRQTAQFLWNHKTYSFSLPKVQRSGIVLRLQDSQVRIQGTDDFVGQSCAVAFLCRGKLCGFQRMTIQSAGYLSVPSDLPTGVNEILVFDANAQPIASRLFFVNHHDIGVTLTVQTDKQDYQPYDSIHVSVKSGVGAPAHISLSVRDAHTDDATYDDGNMLTDLLLSSDLKGFIATPSYYFQSSDSIHLKALDELMMVQGWHRYRRVRNLRYTPETTLTMEGVVYPLPDVSFIESDQVTNGALSDTLGISTASSSSSSSSSSSDTSEESTDDTSSDEDMDVDTTVPEIGVNLGGLKREVLVEAELEKGRQSAGVIQKTTRNGHFQFQIPAFYGDAILFMKAYKEADSTKYCMTCKFDKHFADERAYPDFYVKQDLFYPVFSHPYSYYQTHQPDLMVSATDAGDTISTGSRLSGEHQLGTVKVTAKNRSSRGIDYSKPALEKDVYELYNQVTDYGLSFGIFDFKNFPKQVTTFLYGNFEKWKDMNIRALINGTSVYRNYTPTAQEFDRNQSSMALFSKMRLDRLQTVKCYSDYVPRDQNGLVEKANSPAVTLVFEPVPNDGKRYSYRDRRYVLPGFFLPDEFYAPDYSKRKPDTPTDYRRTLFWDPNASLNDKGELQITCYNNSKPTRVKVSAAGLTEDGRIFVVK